MAKPMLGDIELQLVQMVEAQDDEAQAQHAVPALEGDFLQRLGRRATRISLRGVLAGTEARAGLDPLRQMLRAGEPVPFVADIAAATRVDRVLVEELDVRELAGRPERLEYALALREFIEPPPVVEERATSVDEAASEAGRELAEQTVENIAEGIGGLEVRLALEIEPPDFSGIVILVEGQTDAGERVSFTLREQADGIYRDDDIPAGRYTFTAFRS